MRDTRGLFRERDLLDAALFWGVGARSLRWLRRGKGRPGDLAVVNLVREGRGSSDAPLLHIAHLHCGRFQRAAPRIAPLPSAVMAKQ